MRSHKAYTQSSHIHAHSCTHACTRLTHSAHTLTLARTLTLLHTRAHSHKAYTLTVLTHRLTVLSHAHTHAHSFTHALTQGLHTQHSHIHAHSCTLLHTDSHVLTLAHVLTHRLTQCSHTRSHSCTCAHTHAQAYTLTVLTHKFPTLTRVLTRSHNPLMFMNTSSHMLTYSTHTIRACTR